jgi:hypothetical protein
MRLLHLKTITWCSHVPRFKSHYDMNTVPLDETVLTEIPCRSRCGTNKNSHYRSAKHRSKFTALSDSWKKIFAQAAINKQTNKNIGCNIEWSTENDTVNHYAHFNYIHITWLYIAVRIWPCLYRYVSLTLHTFNSTYTRWYYLLPVRIWPCLYRYVSLTFWLAGSSYRTR